MTANLLENWFKMDVGEGAFYAVFGFAFVVVGIVLLVLIFTGLGKIMSLVNARAAHRAESRASASAPKALEAKAEERAPGRVQTEKEAEEGLSPELVAVIAAAIAAYTEGEARRCGFVVRRIKRL